MTRWHVVKIVCAFLFNVHVDFVTGCASYLLSTCHKLEPEIELIFVNDLRKVAPIHGRLPRFADWVNGVDAAAYLERRGLCLLVYLGELGEIPQSYRRETSSNPLQALGGGQVGPALAHPIKRLPSNLK